MMRFVNSAVLAVSLLAGCEGDDASPGMELPGPTGQPAGNQSPPPRPAVPLPHACGIRLVEISLYQGVKIPLYREGLPVETRNAPIIEGRRALVRAGVALAPGAAPAHAAAQLVLSSPAGVKTYQAPPRLVDVDSTDSALDSTFNFDVSPADVRADTRVSVEIETGAGCAEGAVRRYPAETGVALEARTTGTLKVVLIPVRYEADGSGRMPDVSEEQVQRFEDTLMALYPTSAVELTVRAPTSTSLSLRGDTGWVGLLDALRDLRQSDNPAADVFYYGLVSPATSFTSYCRNACTAGLSYLADMRAPLRQVGLGVGFTGQVAADTLAHELGHQYGRGHAPCGAAAGVDREFPYETGGIGTWGFDFRSMQLQSPRRKDLMSYCSPQWISDYSYAAVASRQALVTAAAGARVLAQRHGRPFRSLLVDGGGRPLWGRSVAALEDAAGTPEPARVLDAAGRVVAEVTVYRTRYGDTSGASLLVPAPEPGWAAIEVDGATPLSYAAPVAVPPLLPVVETPGLQRP